MWTKFASTLSHFERGIYISDIHLQDGGNVFKTILSSFVRRKVHKHFASTTEAVAALTEAGFKYSAQVQAPIEWANTLEYVKTAGSKRVHIIDAKTNW